MMRRTMAGVTVAAAPVGLLAVACGSGSAAKRASDIGLATVISQTPDDVASLTVRVVAPLTGDGSPSKTAELVNNFSAWSAAPGTTSESGALMMENQSRLFPLRAYRTLTLNTADPQFGLVHPIVTFTVQPKSGAPFTLDVGALTFNSGGFYAHKEGTPPGMVYLIPREAVGALVSMAQGQNYSFAGPEDAALASVAAAAETQGQPTEVSQWLKNAEGTGVTVPPGLPPPPSDAGAATADLSGPGGG